MKKIPTLFNRIFEGRKIVGIENEITPGCEEAFEDGAASIKVDGSCCAVFNGVFYKRYDAKPGRKPPVGAIPCCDPDPVTGHWPHWVALDHSNPSDKWFYAAKDKAEFLNDGPLSDGTYEAIGKHFNGNPYRMNYVTLYRHGWDEVAVQRDFESIREWLATHDEEGLVFWLNGEPVCKIKRTDFGLKWPMEE